MTRSEFQFAVIVPGVRLDKFISEQITDLTRSQAQKVIEDGLVTVNQKVVKTGYKIKADDKIDVRMPLLSPSHFTPVKMDITVLYEDDDILVVDKPAGLTVHPAPGYKGLTLINVLLSYLSKFPGETPRPGIVHRLDKDTSGVMVIARHPAALYNIAEQFKKHTVKKVYLALVKGKLTPAEGIIEAPIGRDTTDRTKMAISGQSHGRQARTQYKILRYVGENTLLEAMPMTGRTHQIRVHLAAIGHPVVGDRVYGTKSALVARQFLHALKIGFVLPSNGKYQEFEAKLPVDLTQALKLLA